MWDIISQENIYKLACKTASMPTGWDGIIGHHDGYDAS